MHTWRRGRERKGASGQAHPPTTAQKGKDAQHFSALRLLFPQPPLIPKSSLSLELPPTLTEQLVQAWEVAATGKGGLTCCVYLEG
jgi:hypothetical protein